jgi:Flp pilus assembly protein TadG
MERSFNSQKGAVLIIFALLLTALVGFSALAVEVGRWYLARAELSKAVDAAALTAARNISNPNVNLVTLAQEFGFENFPVGYLGTPGEGDGAVHLDVTRVQTDAGVDTNQFKVTGTVSVFPIFSALFGIDTVVTGGSGVAQKNDVEIMMVLDRSGSMEGTPIANLRTAAKNFLDFFSETQDNDRVGLITYATGVQMPFPLGNNFVNLMKTQIDAMTIPPSGDRDTNMEDAIDQTDGSGGFTDQSGLTGDVRVQQFVLFFTDGIANAFRGDFTRDGTTYEGVIPDPYDVDWNTQLLHHPNTGQPISGLYFKPTGDGMPQATTTCSWPNTMWNIFLTFPVPGYPSPYCNIPNSVLQSYVVNTARQLAVNHAQELKDKGIQIYIIGLGSVDRTFLGKIASGSAFEYYAPTSDQLEAIFNAIAKEIKLRLVK